jgi:hypothetical protein
LCVQGHIHLIWMLWFTVQAVCLSVCVRVHHRQARPRRQRRRA